MIEGMRMGESKHEGNTGDEYIKDALKYGIHASWFPIRDYRMPDKIARRRNPVPGIRHPLINFFYLSQTTFSRSSVILVEQGMLRQRWYT